MSYVVRGLDPAPNPPRVALSDEQLAERGILRMTVTGDGFPCRVGLTDRAFGETMLLLNHVSHDVANPYRAAHAIFVTQAEQEAACYIDEAPPVFRMRVLSLRGFDKDGMMLDAILTQPGEADAGIRKLLSNEKIETIHAHNASRGCFSAKIRRD
jgi:hypothetical protein